MARVCKFCGHCFAVHEPLDGYDVVECPGNRGWVTPDQFEEKASVVKGVGKDSPVVSNAAGGKQSDSPYRCDLLPPMAVLEVAGVLKAGAEKYGDDNWHKITANENINHAMTHLLAHLAGDGTGIDLIIDQHQGDASALIQYCWRYRRKIVGFPKKC